MQTELNLITELVKRDGKCRVNNVAYLLDEENLGECFRMLKKGKAAGIDDVGVEEYEQDRETNLKKLVSRMKVQAYKPLPVRRT